VTSVEYRVTKRKSVEVGVSGEEKQGNSDQ
jgi:hypothetical protein